MAGGVEYVYCDMIQFDGIISSVVSVTNYSVQVAENNSFFVWRTEREVLCHGVSKVTMNE